MAKRAMTGYRRRYPRRKREYVDQQMRIPTVPRPYASKYGDEFFLKVQAIVGLNSDGASTQTVYYMRCDQATSQGVSTTLFDQFEFLQFQRLFAYYEVQGMKIEATVNSATNILGVQAFAGMSPGLPANPVNPPPTSLIQYPIQVVGDIEGSKISCYYAYSKDLKQQGAQFAVSTTGSYPNNQCGVVALRAQFPLAGASVFFGEAKYTWYVRFSSRRSS